MDIALSKIDSIKKCIKRINEEYNTPDSLDNITRLDSIVLNLQRACEQAIDLANYILSRYKFGIPKTSRDSFMMLFDNNIIDKDITEKMKKMVGFRNLAIHDYQKINLDIIKSIIEKNLVDFEKYYNDILVIIKDNPRLFD